jgi:AcrR family transcriptional regulator
VNVFTATSFTIFCYRHCVTASDHPRDRIVGAALDLLERGGRGAVTARAVCDAARVQPQTIYRHFGDMDGLLAAATHEGFRTYGASKAGRERRADPVDDLRDGWDLHVEFGLANPAVYLLMYGDPTADHDSPAARETEAVLRELVEAVARAGRLAVDVDTAAEVVSATGIGVVITLIGRGAVDPQDPLSLRVREAVLRDLTTAGTPSAAVPEAAPHAAALRLLVDPATSRLTPGEALLLDELLARISARS